MNQASETIVLGGGCFWCIEPIFDRLQGVTDVVPGYMGGHVQDPSYEQVCTGNTGHIEVIRVRFDPGRISLETVLRVFFTVHDPTTPDRQGADVGPQYASAIFCETPAQMQVARHVIAEVQSDWSAPVVTQVRTAEALWPAEAVHHDYFARNPQQGYCRVVIAPKVARFRQEFKHLLAP